MRYPTWGEAVVLLAIVAILYGLMLPTPQEKREAELRDLALNWQPANEVAIAQEQLLSADANLLGDWKRGTRRSGSEIEITATDHPNEYRIVFRTGNCGGGCGWSTTATRDGARLTLAEPVADIWDEAFKSFWILSVGEIECLVPVPTVPDFNTAIVNGESDWHYDVFTRGSR